MSWEQIYDFFGIKDFIYFTTSPTIQDTLFPIKIVFILFAAFFFCAVIYFYMSSSYLRYQFFQDVTEFLSWQAFGLREVDRHWNAIMKKIKTGSEKEYKVAIVEADDFLREELEDAEYQGETMEELIQAAGRRVMVNFKDILEGHKIRNFIIHDVNYRLDLNLAKKVLADYEKAIKNVYSY